VSFGIYIETNDELQVGSNGNPFHIPSEIKSRRFQHGLQVLRVAGLGFCLVFGSCLKRRGGPSQMPQV
jgi:hypothetical protein